ncbi:YlbF family regulator [Bacillus sp. 2205SS5-2]|uniref:YlbF family regulator n=1 Tax=Bacillus sp. 2205SS5-2 TaxID=3109031 RepID=UPI003005273A
MLATLERVEILQSSEALAEMILQSAEADSFRACYYRLNNTTSSQRRIRKFTELKELYEEVQRFGRYHPDYQRVMKEIREVKREMDLDEHVANFRKAENDLQHLLDEVSLLIGRSVSEHIKVPTGNPFFQTSSCGGGCGTGGGCSCSA